MAALEAYAPPAWYSFPPYFTCARSKRNSCLQRCSRRTCDAPAASRRLQPVRETRERQMALWKEFVLDFCRAHRVRGVKRLARPRRLNADRGGARRRSGIRR